MPWESSNFISKETIFTHYIYRYDGIYNSLLCIYGSNISVFTSFLSLYMIFFRHLSFCVYCSVISCLCPHLGYFHFINGSHQHSNFFFACFVLSRGNSIVIFCFCFVISSHNFFLCVGINGIDVPDIM